MKLFYTSIFGLFVSSQLFAQATITSMTVHPPYPTPSDMVEVHVAIQTPSSPCPVDYADHTVTNFTVEAAAHHCSGVLTAICNNTDTFELGMLPAGDYTFSMTLTNGYGNAGCTPGFVIDDTDNLLFTVSDNVGIEGIELGSNQIFPNPVSDQLYFKQPLKESAIISDVQGKVVMEIEKGRTNVNVSELPAGTYFVKSEAGRIKLMKD